MQTRILYTSSSALIRQPGANTYPLHLIPLRAEARAPGLGAEAHPGMSRCCLKSASFLSVGRRCARCTLQIKAMPTLLGRTLMETVAQSAQLLVTYCGVSNLIWLDDLTLVNVCRLLGFTYHPFESFFESRDLRLLHFIELLGFLGLV